MTIFFSMRHPGVLRNFASTIRELAERGHRVHLAFMMRDKLNDRRLLQELTDRYPAITVEEVRNRGRGRHWLGLARVIRAAGDALRYETSAYANADALRTRAAHRVPAGTRAFLQLLVVRSRVGRRAIARLLAASERAIPADRAVMEQVSRVRPDLLLVTPLVEFGSDQVEYVKAARTLGIPTGLCVHSWDNLTNKGVIHVLPDRVFVWNDAQKREAVTMHGAQPAQVEAIGAPVYDDWFDRRPSTTREEFCRKTGLSPDRPFFVYLCSSQFIAPDEAAFVEQWVRAIRSAADPRVRDAGILIRPHPRTPRRPWERVDLSALFPNVVLWPKGGANPIDAQSKNDYFDTLFHSAAAVGINTSAQIEAGIAGRAVYSVRVPQYAATQEGTLHFHYLLNESGGLLHLADSLEEHVRMLAGALDRGADAERLRTFVHAFVRPRGLDVPATPLLADAIEALGRLPVRARRSLTAPLLRLALYPIAKAMHAPDAAEGTAQRRRPLRPAHIFRWGPARRFARRHIVPHVLPPAGREDVRASESAPIVKLVQRLSRSDKPIVIGPWLGSVGVELLYWIPFLRWATTYREFDPARLVIVSRAGAAPWYSRISRQYLDALDFLTAEQFASRMATRVPDAKQPAGDGLRGIDRDVLEAALQRLGTTDVELIQPAHLHRLFNAYWRGRRPIRVVEEFTRVESFAPVEDGSVRGALPAAYTAVRIAFNDSFPESADNRAFAARLVQTLSDAGDVVLLPGRTGREDRWDRELALNPRVHHIDDLVTPRHSLDVQTQVISAARAFVGSYSGLSYVAPLCGVTALTFYSDRAKLRQPHVDAAQRAFAGGRGGWHLVSVHDFDLLRQVFGGRELSEVLEPRAARAVRA